MKSEPLTTSVSYHSSKDYFFNLETHSIFQPIMSQYPQRIHQNVSKTTLLTIAIALYFGIFIGLCYGHGRLIEPPSRSSAWRYGFQTPPNYNDHELYCGGFTRQQRNGGKCGECGDPWCVTQHFGNLCSDFF